MMCYSCFLKFLMHLVSNYALANKRIYCINFDSAMQSSNIQSKLKLVPDSKIFYKL